MAKEPDPIQSGRPNGEGVSGREQNPVLGVGIVDRLALRFPEGFSLIYLKAPEYQTLQSHGYVFIENRYQERVRNFKPHRDSQGEDDYNAREVLTRFFLGEEGFPQPWIAPGLDFRDQFGTLAEFKHAILVEKDERAKKIAEEHPDYVSMPTAILVRRQVAASGTHNDGVARIDANDIASKMDFTDDDMVKVALLITERTEEHYSRHMVYARSEFPRLSHLTDEEFAEELPYLSSGLYASDGVQDAVEDFITEKVKSWLVAVAD